MSLLLPSALPYAENQGNKRNWQVALDYIAAHPELDEIIFSGGDPLMAKDHELDWLLNQLEATAHQASAYSQSFTDCHSSTYH